MQKKVTVCVNHRANPEMPSCGSRGIQIAQALETGLAAQNSAVIVERFNCLGCCNEGPNLKFSPGGEFWHDVRLEDVPRLLEQVAAFAQEVESGGFDAD